MQQVEIISRRHFASAALGKGAESKQQRHIGQLRAHAFQAGEHLRLIGGSV